MARLSILSIALCAIAMQAVQHGSQLNPGDKPAADPYWSELQSSMKKMHVAMESLEPSASCDVDFVSLMVPHHQAAIDMAKTQLLYGKDPQVRRLAQEIITDQQSEIELMQLWLKHHQPDK